MINKKLKKRRLSYKQDIVRKTGKLAGLIYTYVPDHPKAFKTTHNPGYYFKHIVLMEKKLGRYLKPGEIVKFKDKNKFNCTIENLYLIDNSNTIPRYIVIMPVVLSYINSCVIVKIKKVINYIYENYKEIYCCNSEEKVKTSIRSSITKISEKKYIKTNKGMVWLTRSGLKKLEEFMKEGKAQKIYVETESGVWMK